MKHSTIALLTGFMFVACGKGATKNSSGHPLTKPPSPTTDKIPVKSSGQDSGQKTASQPSNQTAEQMKTTKGFLKPSDLLPVKLYESTKEEAVSIVRQSESLKADSKSESTAFTAPEGSPEKKMSDCFDAQFNALKITANKESIILEGNLDLSKCMPMTLESISGFKLTHYKHINRYFQMISCDNEDFSKFNGKTFAEVPKGFKPCQNSTKHSELLNELLDEDFSYTISGFLTEKKNKEYSAQSTAEGSACVRTKSGNEWTFENGCIEARRTVVEQQIDYNAPGNSVGKEIFERFQYEGIRKMNDEKSPWYVSGKMNVTVGKWKGDVTFTGANVAPTFSLTDGTEVIAGTIGQQASSVMNLNLSEPGTKTLHEMIKKKRIFRR